VIDPLIDFIIICPLSLELVWPRPIGPCKEAASVKMKCFFVMEPRHQLRKCLTLKLHGSQASMEEEYRIED